MSEWLIWKFIVAYIFSTTAFLILSVFIRSFKNRTERFLNIANGLLLIPLFLNLFLWVKDIAPGLFTHTGQVRNIYSYMYYLSVPVLGCLFHLLFLKKHFRTKKWATIVSLVLLFILVNLEKLVIVLTGSYNDHIPGGWVYYDSPVSEKLYVAGFTTTYFLACWVFSRPKAGLAADPAAM